MTRVAEKSTHMSSIMVIEASIGDRECGGRVEGWERTNGAVEVVVVIMMVT